jgi:hypothetical protein
MDMRAHDPSAVRHERSIYQQGTTSERSIQRGAWNALSDEIRTDLTNRSVLTGSVNLSLLQVHDYTIRNASPSHICDMCGKPKLKPGAHWRDPYGYTGQPALQNVFVITHPELPYPVFVGACCAAKMIRDISKEDAERLSRSLKREQTRKGARARAKREEALRKKREEYEAAARAMYETRRRREREAARSRDEAARAVEVAIDETLDRNREVYRARAAAGREALSRVRDALAALKHDEDARVRRVAFLAEFSWFRWRDTDEGNRTIQVGTVSATLFRGPAGWRGVVNVGDNRAWIRNKFERATEPWSRDTAYREVMAWIRSNV